MSIQLRKSEEKKNDFMYNACVSQIWYKHSNVNISIKVLKRPKLKQKTSFNGFERK